MGAISPALMRRLSRPLVRPNFILPGNGYSFTRGSIGRDTVGGVLTDFAADTPRFGDPSNWLLIEGARTNYVRNPRHEGAVAGTPGTAPTYGAVLTVAGITSSIVGTGTEFGYPYVEIEWTGTATAAGYLGYQPEPNSGGIAASVGQTWAASSGVRISSGSLTNISNTRFRIQERTPSASFATDVLFSPSSSFSSVATSRTLTDAATTGVIVATMFQVAINAAVNFRARFYYFGAEMASSSSTPIYPTIGTPGQSSRSADLLAYTTAQAGLNPDRGTLLLSGSLPQLASAAANQGLMIVHAGSDANRLVLANGAGLNSVLLYRTISGSTTSTALAGSLSTDTLFSVGLTYDAAGVRATLNGGEVSEISGGLPAGLSTALVGQGLFSGAAPMFGRVRSFRTLPFAVSSADLRRRVLRMLAA